MQIKALRYLIELDKAGLLYGGAKRVMVSQQAFGKVISSLEAELGVTLVRRGPHGSRLTEHGEDVLESAKRIVAEHDRMVDRLLQGRDTADQARQRVEVYVSHYAAQIASINPHYVGMLAKDTYYVEEPFEKLMMRASASDGANLVFTDVHSQSLGMVTSNPDLVFEPIIHTRHGLIWRDGWPLAGNNVLHREDVCDLPVAINTSREAQFLMNSLFEDSPFTKVRMGTMIQRMLYEFVQSSQEQAAAAVGDSFHFYLMQKHGMPEAKGLHFTPFATLKAVSQVGFIIPRRIKLAPRAARTVEVLRRYIASNCPDYS